MEAVQDLQIPEKLFDPEYRTRTFYKIVDKNGQLVVFKPNTFQMEFKEQRALCNIILKVRQLGFTTQACVEMLDACLFNMNFTASIIAHDLESLGNIFRKVKTAWDNFDPELRQYLGLETVKYNGSEIEWNNGSKFSVNLSTRSTTVNWLHISEFGKICAKYPLKAEEIITGAIPSVPLNGRITIESTAEGESGSFYEMFWEAWDRRNKPQTKRDFKPFFFDWTREPTYEIHEPVELPQDMIAYQQHHKLTPAKIAWYFLQKKILKSKMAQEYPTTPEEAFVSSGRKIFDQAAISWMLAELRHNYAQNIWKPPIISGDWVYYEPYRPGHRYALGADVGGGVGLDHSTCVIIDFSLKIPKIVARYRSNTISPELFPYEIMAGARAYGNPLVAVEINNTMGGTVITILRNEYPNLYTEVQKNKTLDIVTERIGFLSTSSSKARIIFNFKHAIEEKDIEIPDEMLLVEARKFDHIDIPVVKSKQEDETTRHFDLLVAACIAYEMREYVGYGRAVSSTEPSLENPHSITQ